MDMCDGDSSRKLTPQPDRWFYSLSSSGNPRRAGANGLRILGPDVLREMYLRLQESLTPEFQTVTWREDPCQYLAPMNTHLIGPERQSVSKISCCRRERRVVDEPLVPVVDDEWADVIVRDLLLNSILQDNIIQLEFGHQENT